ncbi:MAG: haloacid dehalogenase [Candidatus Pelagibacter sp.]|nr:haloacid dehalogenase [Candidatus Pelagibacter sp.]|tara:strand:- start:7978 stop:8580 length:603 start_codon:yes stop_codon:yes gene_type:complete
MKIEKVIFDLGKVIVKFDPKNLFRKIFKTEEEIIYFFKNICTWEWHTNQDLVYDTKPATLKKIKEFPKYKDAITAFYGRFQEMIVGIYDDNLKIALDIKKKNIPIFIISNFPGDQFDIYAAKNNFINEFNDKIISGKVGIKKPDKKIYELAIKQFSCSPSKTLFIDDRPENTLSANELGFQTITLDKPEKLKKYLKEFTF